MAYPVTDAVIKQRLPDAAIDDIEVHAEYCFAAVSTIWRQRASINPDADQTVWK